MNCPVFNISHTICLWEPWGCSGLYRWATDGAMHSFPAHLPLLLSHEQKPWRIFRYTGGLLTG